MIKRRMTTPTTGRHLAVEVDVLSAQNFKCLAKKQVIQTVCVIKDEQNKHFFFISLTHF